MNVVKLFQLLHERFIGPFTKLVQSILGGGLNLFMDLAKSLIDLISLKWLTNPKEFIDGILNIPKTLLKVIPDILSSLINFLTFGLADAAGKIIQDGIKNLFGLGGDKKDQETEAASISPTGGGEQKPNPIAQAGNAIAGIASTVLNPIGALTNMVGGMFSGMFGGGEKNKPQLKEGGVVGPEKGGSGVSVEPLDGIAESSGILSSIKKTSKMFMELLTMPFKLVGAGLIALTMNTIGKIPGIGPIITPLLQSIISKFDLPPSIAGVLSGKTPDEKKEEEKKKEEKSSTSSSSSTPEKKEDTKPATNNDMGNLFSMLTGKPAPSSDSSTPGGSDPVASPGGNPGAPAAPGGSLTFDQLKSHARNAGFSDEDAARMAAIAMAESSGNPRAHNSTPPDNSYGLWQINMIGNLGPARRQQLGISSNEQLFDPATNAKAAKMIKDSQGWNAWTVHKTGAYKKFMPSKKEGGWITGPQSGYPVSLDGGMSTSFIGHGTEWVGFKKASGGSVSSAFVIPFDTPSTRSNGGLVGRRMREAKSGGYALPYASGGVVKTDGIWDTGPGYTIQGASDEQGRPIVFSQAAANAFSQMMTASGGKVRGSDVASSKRSPAKNKAVGGASGSKHMYGVAMDIHGSSNAWIRSNGSKYGWVPNDYPGSHGGHFEFKGAGIAPGDTKNQGNQDGTKPDTAGPSDASSPTSSGGGSGPLTTGMLQDLYTMLTGNQPAGGGGSGGMFGGMFGGGGSGLFGGLGSIVGGAFGGPLGSVAGSALGGLLDGKSITDVAFGAGTSLVPGLSNVPNYSSAFNSLQTENLVSTAFSSVSPDKAVSVISDVGKTETSMKQSIDTSSLGNTLPKDGNWSVYKTNL